MCREQYESENEETADWNLDPETRCQELSVECSRLDQMLQQYENSQVSYIPDEFQFQINNRSSCDNRDLLCVGCTEGCTRTFQQWNFFVDFTGKNPELKYTVVDVRCNNEVDTMKVFIITLIITLVLGLLIILLMKVVIRWLDKKEDSRHAQETRNTTLKGKIIREKPGSYHSVSTTRRESTLFSPSTAPLMQTEGNFYSGSQAGGYQTKGQGYY